MGWFLFLGLLFFGILFLSWFLFLWCLFLNWNCLLFILYWFCIITSCFFINWCCWWNLSFMDCREPFRIFSTLIKVHFNIVRLAWTFIFFAIMLAIFFYVFSFCKTNILNNFARFNIPNFFTVLSNCSVAWKFAWSNSI